MHYFLELFQETKKILPSVEKVKEKISIHEERLNSYIDTVVKNALDFAPKLVSALLVLLFGLWLIKRISKLAQKAMAKRDLDVSLRTFLKSLISIGLKIILIVTVAGMIGIGTASFVTILGAAGLAIGLALQGSLSNFAGGVLILIFKPFKVGDNIEAGGQTGEVKEIQIFNTILLTVDHKTVILPNGPLSNGAIVNTTRHGNLRIDVALTVSADTDIEKARNIILSLLDKNDMVLIEPAPGVFIGRNIDGSININVKPYCFPGNTSQLNSALHQEIRSAFEAAGIKNPVPERIIHTIKN